MKTVVISPIHNEGRHLLEQEVEVLYAGWAVTEPVLTPLPGEDQIIELAHDAHAIIVPSDLSTRVVEACPNLRVIGITRGDPRGVDLKHATARDIPVVYAKGRNAPGVADLTLAFIIMLMRQIIPAHRFVEGKHWQSWDALFATSLTEGLELNNRVLGLVGFGFVGQEVARRALAFGMRLLVYDPYLSGSDIAEQGGKKVELIELLEQSDVVSLHCKVTQETRGMIGVDELKAMKPGTYFINTARAAIVDQRALLNSLQSKHLAGAAFDVYWDEPLPIDSPYIGLPNVIHTPHIGGATVEVDSRTTEMVVIDVLSVLRGDSPIHIANPEALSHM